MNSFLNKWGKSRRRKIKMINFIENKSKKKDVFFANFIVHYNFENFWNPTGRFAEKNSIEEGIFDYIIKRHIE